MADEHQNPLIEAVVAVMLFAGSIVALNFLLKVIVKIVFLFVMLMGDKLF